jgi:hypothetical protein
MVRFIALAPVVRLSNMNSKLVLDLKDNQSFFDGMKNSLGPEVLTKSSMNNLITATFVKSALG